MFSLKRMPRLTLASLVFSLVGCRCGTPDQTEATHSAKITSSFRPQIALIDTVEEEGPVALLTYRVGVRRESSMDTIPAVRVSRPPVLVGDSVVFGFDYTTNNGFRFDLETRQLKRISLFSDMNAFFSVSAISPDGKHIAYVGYGNDGSGGPRAVIRTWPEGELTVESPAVVHPTETDFIVNAAKWIDADSFEVWIDLIRVAPQDRYFRVRGSLATLSMKEDTVTAAGRSESGRE